jgi:uncharacterized protein (TIGR03435 family)
MKRLAGLLLMACIGFAQTPISFEVASIRPSKSADTRPFITFDPGGRFTARNASVKRLMGLAYELKSFQISGGPGWIGSELFDISAKAASPPNPDQRKLMLQSLLTERFQLAINKETKEGSAYVLAVARNGPEFKDARDSDPNVIDLSARPDLTGRPGRPRFTIVRRGRLTIQGGSMPSLCAQLSDILGRPVQDKTGLMGTYDLKLEWVPDEYQVAMFQSMGVPEGFGAPPADWQGPSLFTALQEQLGLKLDSGKGPVEMFVIDSVMRPSEN